MRVEIRLKSFLRENALDYHGLLNDLATACKVHRHTIARLYNNTAEKVDLSLLGKICAWIVSRDPGLRGQLPGALIGPAELLPWIKEAGRVRFYLGEYHESAAGGREYTWLARDDAEVASLIAREISGGGSGPGISMEFVPFDVVAKHRANHASEKRRARRPSDAKDFLGESDDLFRNMRKEEKRCHILIGSQRVNLLVERFVAARFGCEPFKPQRRKGVVPFYLAFRQGERARNSCFGGTAPPPGARADEVEPGIYYLDGNRQWVGLPWKKGETSAGVVFAQHQPKEKWLEIALFGFSGKATLELGRAFVERSSQFWPLSCRFDGRDVGVFLFSLTDGGKHEPKLDVIPLDENVLKGCLRRG